MGGIMYARFRDVPSALHLTRDLLVDHHKHLRFDNRASIAPLVTPLDVGR
jgi:hypothetical protein